MIRNWNGSFTLKTCGGHYMRFRVDNAPGIVVVVGATHLIEAWMTMATRMSNYFGWARTENATPFDVASPKLYPAIVAHLEKRFSPGEMGTIVRSNPYLVDEVGAGRTIVIEVVDGEWRYDLLSNHPDWSDTLALSAGEFWSSVGSSWVTKKVQILELLSAEELSNRIDMMMDRERPEPSHESAREVLEWASAERSTLRLTTRRRT